MGAGGHTEETGGTGADNVIRFPRDWFGSKDDLVPFGPAADRLEAAAAAAEPELDSALSADDFWGQGSEALHQPVDVPQSEPPSQLFPADEAPAPAVAADRYGSRGRRLRSVQSIPRVQRIRLPRAGVLIFGAMLTAAVALFVATQTGSHTAAPAQTRSAAVQHVVSMPPDPLAHLQTTMARLMSADLLKTAPKPARHAVSHSRIRTHRSAHRTERHVKATVRTAAAVSQSSPVSTGGTSEASEGTNEVSSSAPVQPAAATPPASSTSSPSTSSGPTGLGSVVGSNCNAQCTG